MLRLFTHVASLLHCVCVCISVHTCLPALIVPSVYVHMYASARTLVFISLSVYQLASDEGSHLPALAFSTLLPPNLQSLLPPSLSHLSIHLAEGFTLLTVKFTHIHNYVFNQSHLKATRMQPFFGSGRRSKSRLGGPSRLIPV